MGLLNWISSGGSIAEKATDAVINAGDALVFTDEERSQANQKKLDWLLEYQKATAPQNVARRVIAYLTVGLWTTIVIAACIAGLFSRAEGSYSVWLFDVLHEILDTPYSVILGFYFLTHVVKAVKE